MGPGREPMMMIFPLIPAKQYAVFKVDDYISYGKTGNYGDAKQVQFQFVPTEQETSVRETVDALALGDKVLLEWQHDYVTKESCSVARQSFQSDRSCSCSRSPRLRHRTPW